MTNTRSQGIAGKPVKARNPNIEIRNKLATGIQSDYTNGLAGGGPSYDWAEF